MDGVEESRRTTLSLLYQLETSKKRRVGSFRSTIRTLIRKLRLSSESAHNAAQVPIENGDGGGFVPVPVQYCTVQEVFSGDLHPAKKFCKQ